MAKLYKIYEVYSFLIEVGEVVADTKEEALEVARQGEMYGEPITFCHHCANLVGDSHLDPSDELLAIACDGSDE